MPLGGCVGRGGFEARNCTQTRTNQGPTRSLRPGGEGGIQLDRFTISLPTARCAAASVEQGSASATTLGQNKKDPTRGPFSLWRCSEYCADDALATRELAPPVH